MSQPDPDILREPPAGDRPVLDYARPGVDRPRLKAAHFVGATVAAVLAFAVVATVGVSAGAPPFLSDEARTIVLAVSVVAAAVVAAIVFRVVLRDCYIASLIPPASRPAPDEQD